MADKIDKKVWLEFYLGEWESSRGEPWIDDNDGEEVFSFEEDCAGWPDTFKTTDIPASAVILVSNDLPYPAEVTLCGVKMKIPKKGLSVRQAFAKWLAQRPQKAPEPFQYQDAAEAFAKLCERCLVPIPFIRPALPTDPCDCTSATEVRLNVEAAQPIDLTYYVRHNFAHYLCDLHCGNPALSDKVADLIAKGF